jgi:hypothetical protein
MLIISINVHKPIAIATGTFNSNNAKKLAASMSI